MSTADIIGAVVAELEQKNVRVEFIDGWEERSTASLPRLNPGGIVCHHTAGKGHAFDYPSLGIVRDGRPDLSGPLAQFGIGRHTGTVYVIAAGKANHAGPGGWNGLSGNASVWGIEAENDGEHEPWAAVSLRSYLLLCVALARHTGFGADMICGHREWTSEKIDPTGIDMDWFRGEVQRVLDGGALGGFDPWDDVFVPVIVS